MAPADDIPVPALARHVVRVDFPLHERAFLERAVLERERPARFERAEYCSECGGVYALHVVGDEGDFRAQERCVHRDSVGQARGDFREHGAQLLFKRRVAVLLKQRVQHCHGERLALRERYALYEEVRLGIAVALPVAFDGRAERVAHVLDVALYCPRAEIRPALSDHFGKLLGGVALPVLENRVNLGYAPCVYLGLPAITRGMRGG